MYIPNEASNSRFVYPSVEVSALKSTEVCGVVLLTATVLTGSETNLKTAHVTKRRMIEIMLARNV